MPGTSKYLELWAVTTWGTSWSWLNAPQRPNLLLLWLSVELSKESWLQLVLLAHNYSRGKENLNKHRTGEAETLNWLLAGDTAEESRSNELWWGTFQRPMVPTPAKQTTLYRSSQPSNPHFLRTYEVHALLSCSGELKTQRDRPRWFFLSVLNGKGICDSFLNSAFLLSSSTLRAGNRGQLRASCWLLGLQMQTTQSTQLKIRGLGVE